MQKLINDMKKTKVRREQLIHEVSVMLLRKINDDFKRVKVYRGGDDPWGMYDIELVSQSGLNSEWIDELWDMHDTTPYYGDLLPSWEWGVNTINYLYDLDVPRLRGLLKYPDNWRSFIGWIEWENF